MEPQRVHHLGRPHLSVGAVSVSTASHHAMVPVRGLRIPIAAVLGWWLARQIRTGLDGVFVAGQETLHTSLQDGPIVVACTHQSWWDGLVAVWVCRALDLHPTVLMRADNLARWPFFEAFGAVGVAGPKGLRACLDRLAGPGDLLWTFPQGAYRDPEARPLGLQRGTAWIARRAGARVVPVALGYRFAQQPRTRAFLSIGPAIEEGAASDDALLQRLEAGLIAELERIGALPWDADAAALAAAGFTTPDGSEVAMHPPRPDVASRLLGWIWRWS
jgi:1-acyl-sn-glycerol-3-phosphate acyltransferase